jgi:iron complex transport system substrate-binding protein
MSTVTVYPKLVISLFAIPLAIVLGACGGQAPPTSAVPSTTTQASPMPTSTAAPAALPVTVTDARELSKGSSSGSASASAVAAQVTANPKLPTTVVDYQGKTKTVSSIDRIISMNATTTEIIYALGLGDRLMATDDGSKYPPEAQALPKVGGHSSLNPEGILSLQPTVLIGDISTKPGPAAALEQVESSGVPVVTLPNPTTLEGVTERIRRVAQALGVPERGEALAKTVDQDLAAARARVQSAATGQPPRVLFLYLVGQSGTYLAGGTDTSIAPVIQAAGAINAGAEAGIQGYRPMTPEAVAAAQPDVILVLTRGLQSVGGLEGVLRLPGVAQTPAGQQRRVVDMDDYVLGLGPRTGKAVLELQAAVFPNTKPEAK